MRWMRLYPVKIIIRLSSKFRVFLSPFPPDIFTSKFNPRHQLHVWGDVLFFSQRKMTKDNNEYVLSLKQMKKPPDAAVASSASKIFDVHEALTIQVSTLFRQQHLVQYFQRASNWNIV